MDISKKLYKETEKMYILAIIVLAVIIIAAVCVVIAKKNTSGANTWEIPTETREILSLTDVVSFFKQPDLIKLLKEDQNRIAVAIKEEAKEDSVIITLCIYSKESQKLIMQEKAKRYKVSKLSDDLKSIFGEKDMIVLQ